MGNNSNTNIPKSVTKIILKETSSGFYKQDGMGKKHYQTNSSRKCWKPNHEYGEVQGERRGRDSKRGGI